MGTQKLQLSSSIPPTSLHHVSPGATEARSYKWICANLSLSYCKMNCSHHVHTLSHPFLLLSHFLPGYESQKFPYDSTVLHDSLHVDCLTVSEHLVTQSVDWPIPKRQSKGLDFNFTCGCNGIVCAFRLSLYFYCAALLHSYTILISNKVVNELLLWNLSIFSFSFKKLYLEGGTTSSSKKKRSG